MFQVNFEMPLLSRNQLSSSEGGEKVWILNASAQSLDVAIVKLSLTNLCNE